MPDQPIRLADIPMDIGPFRIRLPAPPRPPDADPRFDAMPSDPFAEGIELATLIPVRHPGYMPAALARKNLTKDEFSVFRLNLARFMVKADWSCYGAANLFGFNPQPGNNPVQAWLESRRGARSDSCRAVAALIGCDAVELATKAFSDEYLAELLDALRAKFSAQEAADAADSDDLQDADRDSES